MEPASNHEMQMGSNNQSDSTMNTDQTQQRRAMPSDYLQNQPQGKPQINPHGVANSCNWVYINGLGERD